MKKILINVPKQDKKWVVNNHYRRARADTVINLIEKLLLTFTAKDKTSVLVKYGELYVNESIASQNAFEQLWIASCFLEDYLSMRSLNRIAKLYERNRTESAT